MKIRKILKGNILITFLYNKFLKWRYSQNRMTESIFTYHKKRFYKYSGAFNASQLRDRSYLIWLYHVIEKGLAMPDMRYGFGTEKIAELIKKIREYKNKYGIDNELTNAVSTLLEYQRIHSQANYTLREDITSSINQVKTAFSSIEPLHQKVYTKKEYYSFINSEFPLFSLSRHSIRNFSKHIDIKLIIRSIDIAKNAPSACNRQPYRVHIIENRELINQCLALQNGNRGFGHLADKLLIITGDMETILGAQEFFDLNTNVGIFIMNLCYALHYNKIAHCVLNWYVLPKEDMKLRKLLNIKNSETIVAYILCGDLPEQFKIVVSPKIKTEQIYILHS